MQVEHVIEMPHNNHLSLAEASRYFCVVCCTHIDHAMRMSKHTSIRSLCEHGCSILLLMCRLCNRDIVTRVQQVICFAFHDSRLLLETCREAQDARKIVTLFYLD